VYQVAPRRRRRLCSWYSTGDPLGFKGAARESSSLVLMVIQALCQAGLEGTRTCGYGYLGSTAEHIYTYAHWATGARHLRRLSSWGPV
jgi:hypothetical protein